MSVEGPCLETQRLRLRPFEPEDLDAYARIVADPLTMRFIGDGVAQDRTDAELSLGHIADHWARKGFGLWAVEERQSGALVGRIGLYFPDDWPGLEVGWLVDRERWGEGFAPEGAAAAMQYAFTSLEVPRLISLIRAENQASIRVAEKLGERFAGELVVRGKPARVYAIDRVAWASRS